ncbi:TAXI family TRAP transporter solute-binding subunit [Bradyrhizobium prioriisuperbiae]|uniref:TAXI family TRAP transporter solute-binding subunit n=1 Tax=Bradyrhizobium prioriisuperbiae TaxID=2854389 RepID=UPI0038992509
MNLNLQQMFSRSPPLSGPGEPVPGPTPVRGKRAPKGAGIFMPLAAALAIVLVVVGAIYIAMRPVTLKIAVGPPNSEDVKVMQALAHTFSRERGYIRLKIIPTEGATASAAALSNKVADLAVIRGDLDVPKDAASVAVLRKNLVVLWVPSPGKGKKVKNPIKKIQNLAGRRVGVIGKTTANINLLKVILRQYGVDPAKVEVVQFSTNEVAEATRTQKVDAFLAAGPLNSKITADALAASQKDGGEPTFLAIDAADAIAQNFPAYDAAEIPAGVLGGVPPRPEEEVKTISFSHHIVARKSLSEATIGMLTRQIFAQRQNAAAEAPSASKIETPDTDKDADIPAHPGAAAYVDGEEKTFLDRYSDFIWWGIMGLSAMGSLGAWFAGYLKRDERQNNTTLRDRLLEMLSQVRQASTHQELDGMQAEADTILRNTLRCYEDGAIDDGPLTAFNIALEQFHTAVADRRSVLMATPPRPTVQLRA